MNALIIFGLITFISIVYSLKVIKKGLKDAKKHPIDYRKLFIEHIKQFN